MSQSVNGSTKPQIIEFGPCRIVGMRYVGKNENEEIKALWDKSGGFLARMGEITRPADGNFALGLCRCLPGVTDGSFEYIAAVPAKPDAPVPAGMTEAHIEGGTYVKFMVPTLADLMEVWGSTGAWLATHPEWEPCCGEGGCDCANHPAFEYYPQEFSGENELFIYFPVKPRA